MLLVLLGHCFLRPLIMLFCTAVECWLVPSCSHSATRSASGHGARQRQTVRTEKQRQEWIQEGREEGGIQEEREGVGAGAGTMIVPAAVRLSTRRCGRVCEARPARSQNQR